MDNEKRNSLAAARVSAQVAFLTKVVKDSTLSPLTRRKAQEKLDYIRDNGSLDGPLTDVYK